MNQVSHKLADALPALANSSPPCTSIEMMGLRAVRRDSRSGFFSNSQLDVNAAWLCPHLSEHMALEQELCFFVQHVHPVTEEIGMALCRDVDGLTPLIQLGADDLLPTQAECQSSPTPILPPILSAPDPVVAHSALSDLC